MDTIANKLFLSIFYRLCSQFVQHYPKASHECDRLQTWAAIESFADLNTPNLGKTIHDAGKPYFFSRKWASADHNPSKLSVAGPLFVAFEEPGIFADLFAKQKQVQYNLQLSFLEKYQPAKGPTKDPCKSRTRNEIYLHSEHFARAFFSYLGDVAYYDGHGFYNRAVAATVLEGSPVENVTITRQFIKMLKDQNPQVQHTRFEGGINEYHGTYCTISLSAITCEEFMYDAATTQYKIGYDAGCC